MNAVRRSVVTTLVLATAIALAGCGRTAWAGAEGPQASGPPSPTHGAATATAQAVETPANDAALDEIDQLLDDAEDSAGDAAQDGAHGDAAAAASDEP
jgi:hypothetical protein